jgi:hypothetical protein
MRPCNFLALAACCLLALGLRTSTERARAQAPALNATAASRAIYPTTWEMEYYGETPKDAEDGALQAAAEKVTAYFHQNVPALSDWSPSAESLANKRVISLLDGTEQVELPDKVSYRARVKVEITSKNVGELAEEARGARMHDRQLLLARLLAGAVALLLVVAGYLRLEDATRGYYTTLLRLAAVGVVVVVGAGLWLLA